VAGQQTSIASLGEETGMDARATFRYSIHTTLQDMDRRTCRRISLLEWAHAADAWILEDDYDSEFRYVGRPLAALQGLDMANRVIYLGTFSKVLFPALRLGYLVVPPDLVGAFIAAHLFTDMHCPVLEQSVLAAFINEGHFARHIRRMRLLYSERQAALVNLVEQELAGLLDIQPAAAGMHLIGWLPWGWDDRQVARAAASASVDVSPLSLYSLEAGERPGILLGYTAVDAQEMRAGIHRLASALTSSKRDT